MKNSIFKTNPSFGPFVLRILLGLVIFVHGAQKLLGWFGGSGFENTMNYLIDTVGLPWLVACLTIILESMGALALMAGFGTRLLAIAFTVLGIGIVFTGHIEHGFFMNWYGNQTGEGYEYFLLWIGMSISLIFSGGGIMSIDKIMGKRLIIKNKNYE